MEIKEAIKIINQYDMNFHWNDGEPIPAEQLADAFGLAISALEKQEQERWISVTERLPETTDEVLTTYINNGNRKKRYVETATYYPDDGEGTWMSPWNEYRIAGTAVEVLAWRPLPAPYQEDEA